MKPLVIGHAAAAGEAPANTLAGVRAALDAGAEAMEIDIQLSADRVPVLMHDLTVDRTTNLRGQTRSFTAAQLTRADAGDGECVPSLDSVLSLVAGRLTVMCELKTDPDRERPERDLVDAVLSVIARHEASSWVAIHSFDPSIVEYSRQVEARVSAAIIAPNVDAAGMERLLNGILKRNGQALSIQHNCITPELVTAAKRRQITIWTWTADTAADWSRVTAAGVDGIITNVPHRLREYLDARA
jgi:glycerophosphoryl diester phosphodiesterase